MDIISIMIKINRLLAALILVIGSTTIPTAYNAEAGFLTQIIKSFTKQGSKHGDRLGKGSKDLDEIIQKLDKGVDDNVGGITKKMQSTDESLGRFLASDHSEKEILWALKSLQHTPSLTFRTISRKLHQRSCPSMDLRLSLPQKSVPTTLSSDVKLRVGPGNTDGNPEPTYQKGAHDLDLLTTHECWVAVGGYPDPEGNYIIGWVPAKEIEFWFQNHLTMPTSTSSRLLETNAVFQKASKNTYMINVTDTKGQGSQGSAVAISSAVLLTNCHVLHPKGKPIYIIENDNTYPAFLLRDNERADQCFIRSLEIALKPVDGIKTVMKVERREPSFAIGAPKGTNRTMSQGQILDLIFCDKKRDINCILSSAMVDFGSSGGGLFDGAGNLVGITTLKTKSNHSISIAATEFWE